MARIGGVTDLGGSARTVGPTRGEPLDEDAVFDILGNARRRAVVVILQQDGQTSLDDLAERIAAVERGSDDGDDAHYKSVYVSLQQTHLPKLEAANVVTYDRDARTVTPGPKLGDVASLTDTARRIDLASEAAQLVACAVGLGALVAMPGEAFPGGGEAVAAGVLAAIGCLVLFRRTKPRLVWRLVSISDGSD